MSPSADVLVAGAGPVGMTAALALRALGRPVTVLEAGPENRDRPGSRAIFTHSATLEVLERLRPGLSSAMAEYGAYWTTQRTFFGEKEVYGVTYPEPEPGTRPHFTSLPQIHIERFLYEACVDAGVTFAWDQEITGVTTSADGVVITTAAGRTWDAQYVVGADGARSVVRGEIGARMEGSKDDGWYIVVDLADQPSAPMPLERRFWYQHPAAGGRNVLLVPFRGGWRLDLQLRDDDDPEELGSPEGVRAWVSQILDPVYAETITWISTYQFMQLVAHDFADVHRRVLLVGEAAHLFAPFGARGLNSGVPDAEQAAWAINTALCATNPALATAAVEAFTGNRRAAALFNKNAAGEALAHLRPDAETTERINAAGAAAPQDREAGTWLEKAPYGPRGVPTATTVYRY